MAIEKELLDQLLAGRDPKDVFNKEWVGRQLKLKKALSERILNTELDEHLDDNSVDGKSHSSQRLFEEVGSDRHLEDDAYRCRGIGPERSTQS